MSSPMRPSLLLRGLRELALCLFYFAKTPWFSVQVENRPAIEDMGPVIIAPNHVSFLDPMVLQGALRSHVTFMMTEGIYKKPVIHWFFRLWGVIPVPDDRNPAGAIRGALRTLRAGRPIVIFPEGRVSSDGLLKKGMGGVGMILSRCRVPVIPVAIIGTYEVLPRHGRWPRRHRVTVRFGEPMDPGDLPRSESQAFVDRVMEAIAAEGAARA